MIKVSVVVAVYNAQKYLQECMDSILGQTLKEIEVICVDDGSVDASLAILNDYQKRDSRVQVVHQENSGPQTGAAEARNKGMLLAKGRYLSVLDADDFFEPDMLEKAYGFAEANDLDIVTYDGYKYDDLLKRDMNDLPILNTKFLPDQDIAELKDVRHYIFQLTIGAAWNCLYRRKFIEENSLAFQPLQHADDLLFVYLAFAKSKRWGFLKEKLIHYRRNNAESQSSLVDAWADSCYQALRRLKDELTDAGLYELTERSFINRAADYMTGYLYMLKDGHNFERFYRDVKEKYLKEFLIEDKPEEYFFDKGLYMQIQRIKNENVFEYVWNDLSVCRKSQVTAVRDYRFPYDQILPGERIAVYGAGSVGTAFYLRLVASHYCQVVLWVDRQHEILGKPVEDPERLTETAFDKLLIAVDKEELYKQIKAYLCENLHIEEQKLVWQRQYSKK